ncbi:hypothetical protein N0V85_002589 [Neurospora sp. IMI 360204]|nr:hypothetical protein N0V85_002589 [Neurospora sp. IMI 360204]
MLTSTVMKQLPRASTRSLCRPIQAASTRLQPHRLYHETPNSRASVETARSLNPTDPIANLPPTWSPAPTTTIRPQLDVTKRVFTPSYYTAIAEIMKLRSKYITNRSIFIEGTDMVSLLLGLGATPSDLDRLKHVSDNLYSDPTLPFRRSRNGRFCFDFSTSSVRRLEFQPFALSVEEDFKRHDSGQIRMFDEVQDELQLNTAFQALLVFKGMICHGVSTAQRPRLDYSSDKWVCTLFNLRTVTTPSILGEPALEGVHTDGVDHTMTTYLGSENMDVAANSAVTFMHDMNEETGAKYTEIKPQNLRSRVQHRHFLDTLLLVDTENKHSLSPVLPVDETKEATRDMLIFFTRRPVKKGDGGGHISESIDSFRPHGELPMEVPLFLPGKIYGKGE